MNFPELIDEAGAYVTQYAKARHNKNLVYHNLQHTRSVVAAATQIANHYQLNEIDFFTVVVAAWFHDLGYFNGPGAGHEQRGASLADQFLTAKGVDAVIITGVKNCILATVMPQHPVSLTEQIVSDADLFHFGTDSFSERNKLMHTEMELVYDKTISKKDWRRQTIQLMETHRYHTKL